jgi:hypothetical protein
MENFFDASRKSIITSDELNFEKIRNNFSRLIPIHLLLKGSGRFRPEPFLFSKKYFLRSAARSQSNGPSIQDSLVA